MCQVCERVIMCLKFSRQSFIKKVSIFIEKPVSNRKQILLPAVHFPHFPTHLLFLLAGVEATWHLLCHRIHSPKKIPLNELDSHSVLFFSLSASSLSLSLSLCLSHPLSTLILLLSLSLPVLISTYRYDGYFLLITEHVYAYISKHMFLVSHSLTQCLRYSQSNGCWLKKRPPKFGWGIQNPPPPLPSISRGPAGPFLKLHRM